jgi:protein-S-isoprenylcysteine O-methyltransferase Ste14
MRRIVALIIYAAFLGTFLYFIGFVEGWGVPKTIDSGAPAPFAVAAAIDLALIALFGVQHSVMARAAFKARWTKLTGEALERSAFVLASTLLLALVCWQWRPLPATLWSAAAPALRAAIVGVSLAGWALLLVSTFLYDHFELFGLRQAFSSGKATSPRFRTPAFYRWVRHPMYLGMIVAFWATPTMTVGHLVFALAMTAYVAVGVRYEERDLVRAFGDDYERYRERVGMLVPYRRD